jgi:hypothetical protein
MPAAGAGWWPPAATWAGTGPWAPCPSPPATWPRSACTRALAGGRHGGFPVLAARTTGSHGSGPPAGTTRRSWTCWPAARMLLALGDGRVELMDGAGGFTPVDPGEFRGTSGPAAPPGGWLAAGRQRGRTCCCIAGASRRNCNWTATACSAPPVPWPDEVLLCGNRGLLARLDRKPFPANCRWYTIPWSDRVMQQAAPAPGTACWPWRVLAGLPRLDVSAPIRPYLFSLLDGNPGMSDNQNKLDRLARNYNQASLPGRGRLRRPAASMWTPEAGWTHGRRAGRISAQPGLGGYALEILNSLEFTPGHARGEVRAHTPAVQPALPPVHQQRQPLVQQDEFSPGALLDSLSRLGPGWSATCPSRSSSSGWTFPARPGATAGRGSACCPYELLPGQPPARCTLLRETPDGSGIRRAQPGGAAGPGPARGHLEAPFTRLHVQHRLHYDRRQAAKPAKAEEKGHRFSESLYTVALVDSADFTPGLANLKSRDPGLPGRQPGHGHRGTDRGPAPGRHGGRRGGAVAGPASSARSSWPR